MLPAEQLRQEISKKYNINLEQYKWSEEFKKEIFAIKLDKALETHTDTLEDIYLLGFNIGHCGLTSRYVARRYPEATLYYGTAKILKETPCAPNGEHAWTIINGYIIDTTLMICFPISKAKEFGYITEKEIEHHSARMLSEYDLYENDFKTNITTYKKV